MEKKEKHPGGESNPGNTWESPKIAIKNVLMNDSRVLGLSEEMMRYIEGISINKDTGLFHVWGKGFNLSYINNSDKCTIRIQNTEIEKSSPIRLWQLVHNLWEYYKSKGYHIISTEAGRGLGDLKGYIARPHIGFVEKRSAREKIIQILTQRAKIIDKDYITTVEEHVKDSTVVENIKVKAKLHEEIHALCKIYSDFNKRGSLIQDLLALEGGKEFWHEYGEGFDAYLSIRDHNDISYKKFNDYIHKKQ